MTKRRKSIKLFPHERQALIDVYLKWRFAVDSYESLPDELEAMVDQWKQRCGRKDAPQDVFHYMRNERKCSRWVTFDGKHKEPPPIPKFTAEETEILVDIYTRNVAELDAGSDTLGYDSQVADFVAREFTDATGRTVPAHYCVAKLTAIRKRGLLPKATKPPEGFGDISQATS
jgi:hypothetical protein